MNDKAGDLLRTAFHVPGLAFRVPDGPGLDGPWDLLLSGSGGGTVSRLLPLPARHWTATRHGSLMPYRWHDRLRRLCAVAAPVDSTIQAMVPMVVSERRQGHRQGRR